jgi:hypothetical protein
VVTAIIFHVYKTERKFMTGPANISFSKGILLRGVNYFIASGNNVLYVEASVF